jgi:hypothetical protein
VGKVKNMQNYLDQMPGKVGMPSLTVAADGSHITWLCPSVHGQIPQARHTQYRKFPKLIKWVVEGVSTVALTMSQPRCILGFSPNCRQHYFSLKKA